MDAGLLFLPSHFEHINCLVLFSTKLWFINTIRCISNQICVCLKPLGWSDLEYNEHISITIVAFIERVDERKTSGVWVRACVCASVFVCLCALSRRLCVRETDRQTDRQAEEVEYYVTYHKLSQFTEDNFLIYNESALILKYNSALTWSKCVIVD